MTWSDINIKDRNERSEMYFVIKITGFALISFTAYMKNRTNGEIFKFYS